MKKQSGFSVIELLLALVLLIGLGTIGYAVWKTNQTNKQSDTVAKTQQSPSSHTTASGALHLSTTPTYYDCMDAYSADINDSNVLAHPADHAYVWKTGECTLNGKSYDIPKTFTDDNIRDSSSALFDKKVSDPRLRLTESEANYLRGVGKNNFKTCANASSPDEAIYGTTELYNEASGKYLYFSRSCSEGGAGRQIAVLTDSAWKLVYNASDNIYCATITKYDIPHNLFASDEDCYNSSTPGGVNDTVKISSLK